MELSEKPGITSNGVVPGFVLLCLFPQQFRDWGMLTFLRPKTYAASPRIFRIVWVYSP